VLTTHPRAVPLRPDTVPFGRRDKRGDIVIALNRDEEVTALLHQFA
jgi:hypothetical protein